jgi:hypothetical protein
VPTSLSGMAVHLAVCRAAGWKMGGTDKLANNYSQPLHMHAIPRPRAERVMEIPIDTADDLDSDTAGAWDPD